MRIATLRLSGYKGIDVSLRWQPAIVLFGPNDAGKTNILEAIASAFGSPEFARPAADGGSPPAPAVDALLELDPTEDTILSELLQMADVWPYFQALDIRAALALSDHDDEVELRCRVRWCGGVSRPRSFLLTGAQPAEALSFAELREILHTRALRAMRGWLTDPASWADAETLLTAALASRWLRFHGDRVTWMSPPFEESRSAAVLSAASRLSRAGWRENKVLGPFVSHVMDGGSEPRGFLEMTARRSFRPFEIVWASAGLETADALEVPLRAAFDTWYALALEARKLLKRGSDLAAGELLPEEDRWIWRVSRLVSGTALADRWMQTFFESVRPGAWVEEHAREVAQLANELAAPLVRDAGEITLNVRPIRLWAGGTGRRLEPGLRQPHRDHSTPITEVGMGVRLWASIALLEAAAVSSERLKSLWSRLLLAGILSPPSEESAAAVAVRLQPRLLIIDEPERHLHPRAQVELVKWLVQGAADRDTLLASHSVPFLRMGPDIATTALVVRGGDGLTITLDLTGDTFERLSLFEDVSGLSSRAEALHVLNGLLFVEGAHDERLLHHFFGERLARERILVVPVRGATNVNAIIDAPWVSRYGAPFVILFDEVQADQALGTERPRGKHNLAARAIWDLLAHWDEPRERPQVVSFSLPDILRALPARCVERIFRSRGGTFPGWQAIDAAYQKNPDAGFKKIVLVQSGLPVDSDIDALLDLILAVCSRERPDEVLEESMREVFTMFGAGWRKAQDDSGNVGSQGT